MCAQPYLSQAISMVNICMRDPQGHWELVNWILRYNQGTVDIGGEYLLICLRDTSCWHKIVILVHVDEVNCRLVVGLGFKNLAYVHSGC